MVPAKIDYEDIGRQIRKFRTEQHMRQKDLASKLDVEAPHISHIENAQTQLSLPTFVSIANALEVTSDDLLCGSLVAKTNAPNNEVAKILEDCSPEECRVLINCLKEHKRFLRTLTGQK